MGAFHGISESRRGRSHVDSGTVCQDSTLCLVSERYAIAAVSDGHGGAKHFRSDVGSKAATECAVRVIKEFVESEGFEASFRSNQDVLLDTVCRTVLASWYSAIDEYDEGHPLTDAEIRHISERNVSERCADKRHRDRYGATLMAAVVSDWFSFCIQIGDGAIACIGEDGIDRAPMPEDPDCALNVTTSLCQLDPLRSFRHWHSIGWSPMAIVMSTDGITNTFESTDSYVRYCRKASCFALDGGNQWRRLMDRNKARSNANGMDDVSMAVVCRECPALRKMKDGIDEAYRELDLKSTVPAARKGLFFVHGAMRFHVAEGLATLAVYDGSDSDIAVPERLAADGKTYEVAGIGPRCFDKARIHSVSIPRTVQRIAPKAFFKCPKLRAVTFEGEPEMDSSAFFNCPRLSEARYAGDEPPPMGANVKKIRIRAPLSARTGTPSSCSGSTGPCAPRGCGRQGPSALSISPACRDACLLSCWTPGLRG